MACAIRTVQELLGHSDVKTTMTCTHVLNRIRRWRRRPASACQRVCAGAEVVVAV